MLMSIALGAGAAGCGGGPALGGVPRPNAGAMAGGAAAAAAAITLADPHAADRKPEQRVEQDKRPVEVKEQVPASALDRLDSGAAGSGQAAPGADATTGADQGSAAKPTAKPAVLKTPPAKPVKPAGKVPVLPSPHDAVDPDHADAR